MCSMTVRKPGVARAENLPSDAEQIRLRLFPNRGETLTATISRAVQERGWQISELHVEKGRLDNVFREVTSANMATSQGGSV